MDLLFHFASVLGHLEITIQLMTFEAIYDDDDESSFDKTLVYDQIEAPFHDWTDVQWQPTSKISTRHCDPFPSLLFLTLFV